MVSALQSERYSSLRQCDPRCIRSTMNGHLPHEVDWLCGKIDVRAMSLRIERLETTPWGSCKMKSRITGPASRQFEGYGFKSHLLQEGDILLCTDPDSEISSLIRYSTGGNFSHAAICTLVPLFIEASDPGVCEFSLDRMGVKSKANVRVLRLRSDVPNREHIATTAAREALRYSTREYGTIAAIASVVPGWGYEPGARAFCSYLVAAAYESAGLNITKNIGSSWNRVGKIWS